MYTYYVCDPVVGASIVRIQIQLLVFYPGTIGQAELETGNAYKPVRRRVYEEKI